MKLHIFTNGIGLFRHIFFNFFFLFCESGKRLQKFALSPNDDVIFRWSLRQKVLAPAGAEIIVDRVVVGPRRTKTQSLFVQNNEN
jgi:hypothetical protein